MEEFFQYIGRASTAAGDAPLVREKLFLYTSPRENAIDRCGEVPVGAYFACSSISVFDDECWMKIRRGVFSNAKLNGYIRVAFDWSNNGDGDGDSSELPAHQHTSIAAARPSSFKYLRRLPTFPAFLCARERLLVSRIPVFSTRERQRSFSSSDTAKPQSSSSGTGGAGATHQRFLPAVSVVHATECQFSDDFSQMALKVTSSFGLTGWVTASFHDTLIVVDDPRSSAWRESIVYVQNVAPRTGKWMGELPVRAVPSLQAPRLGTLAPFRIVEALERKLVKDQVWIKIRYVAPTLRTEPSTDAADAENSSSSEAVSGSSADASTSQDEAAAATSPPSPTEAWIIERNVNSGERVVVPWGADSFGDAQSSGSDTTERFYRNVYTRRALPLRKTPELSADVVGQLAPGAVVTSSARVLNAHGRMWIRVALEPSCENNPQDAMHFGYAIQSNAKTNRCMLQEIAAPGKMAPPQLVHIRGSAATNATVNDSDTTTPSYITAHAEPSASSKALFGVRHGAVVHAVGSQLVTSERRVWLQVLTGGIDSAMRVALPNVVLSTDEQQQNVVYVAVCDAAHPADIVARPIYARQLVKIANPSAALSDDGKKNTTAARVVFSGRASKLFGSQLMQPSTLDLPSLTKSKADSRSSGSSGSVGAASRPAAAAAGETQDPAQALKAEIDSWQLESEHLSAITTYARSAAAQLGACVARPFRSCLAKKDAMRKYEQLYQDDDEDDDDDDDLEYGRRSATLRAHEHATEVRV